MPDISLEKQNDYYIGRFKAMASPCEILSDTLDSELAYTLTRIAMTEAHRIEKKFSRYRNDNIIYSVNRSRGKPVDVDEETADLFDYAQQCYQLSEGLFDITSGVLRKIWRFDGSDNIANQQLINQQLALIGWEKIIWARPTITLKENMEVDLGGIGKEYSVDRSTQLIQEASQVSCLINFGGDIRVTRARNNDQPWVIGVEDPDNLNNPINSGDSNKSNNRQRKNSCLFLSAGSIATSGDARKFLLKNGIRYSHILNPKTGWPVKNAPRSVTVAADTCTEAGILSTLALLHEADAEHFLKLQRVKYWCEW